MKKVLRFSLMLLATLFASVNIMAQTDVTSQYIKNADFDVESDWVAEGNVALNPASKGNVAEWTCTSTDSWNGSAVLKIGSTATMNNATVPALNAAGAAEGGAFACAASWQHKVQYTQEITLPAGSYVLSFDAYEGNSGAQTNGLNKNLIGFIAADGTEYLAKKEIYTVGEWTNHEIKFTLLEETTGKMSIGYESMNVTSNVTPKLFIDNLKLTQGDIEYPVDFSNKAINRHNGWTKLASKGTINNYSTDYAEFYNAQHVTGDIMQQAVNVPNGKYNVEVYFNANCANWECTPVAEAEGQTGYTVMDINGTTVNTPVRNSKSLTSEQPYLYSLNDIEVTDGNLTFKVTNLQEAANWITVSIANIQLEAPEIPEPLVSEAALVDNGVEITLNDHMEVSAEQAEGVTAKVASGVREANYAVRNMMMIEGEESSQWVATDTITAGDMSINGTAFAEFDEPITFEAGNKYMVTITAKDANEVEETATYIINGAYAEPLVLEAALLDNSEEITLSDHMEVSAEQADGVAARVASGVREAYFAVRNMMMIEGEESSQWVATDTITAGEMSINGAAFAEFDEPIIFEAGNKYQVIITAKDVNEVEETATYIINGAYAEPLVSEAAIISNGEEITLNDHMEISAEQAEGVTAKVASGVREANYAVRNMLMIEGEESSQWVATDTITAGDMSINGTAFAEFDKPILFYTGTKYMISITAKDANEVEETVSYVVNGAYEEQLESEVIVSMMDGEDEVALNSHSAVAVEKADAVKVQFVDMPTAIGATYLINEMKMGEDSTGVYWNVGKELAAGEIYPNGGIAYGQFETALTFYEGMKYQVSVTAMENPADPQEIGTYTFEFIGAYSEPIEPQVIPSLVDNLTEVTLNNHSEVSVECADAMKVEFVDMPAVIGATYLINEMVMIQDNDSIFWNTGKELAAGEMSVNGVGYAEFESALTFYQGKKYQLSVTAFENAADPQEIGTYTFVFNGSYAESESTDLLVNGDFATVGELASGATDRYAVGEPWVSNVAFANMGIRVMASDAATRGGNVLVWRGSGNGNYISQPVNVEAGETYKVTISQVASGNANANFNVGLGSEAGKYDIAAGIVRLGTNNNGVKTLILTMPAETEAETIYFTFANTNTNTASSGNDPVSQIDYITMEKVDALQAAKDEALASLPVADESLFTPTIADVAAIKLAIEEATTVAEVEEAMAGVADLTVPALTGEYRIINATDDLFMGVNGTQPILSETEALATFGKMQGGFSIKIGETYINMKGGGNNTWSMSADAEAKTAWNFTLQDGKYTIKGPNGLIGSDSSEDGAFLYGNKAVNNNGLWTIMENNPNNDAYEEYVSAIEALKQQFTHVYNTTVNNAEYQDEKFAAVIEEMNPVLNAVQQHIATLDTWAEESYQAGTLATVINEIYSEIESVQTELTQFLNTFNEKIAEILEAEAAEAFMTEYEALQQYFTMVYNTTVNNEDYAKYVAVIEEQTPILNSIYQNMSQLETWAEESMEAHTLAADLEEIFSNFESIQIQLTQFLNSFNQAIEDYENTTFMIYTDENGNEHMVTIHDNMKVTWKSGAEILEEKSEK